MSKAINKNVEEKEKADFKGGVIIVLVFTLVASGESFINVLYSWIF